MFNVSITLFNFYLFYNENIPLLLMIRSFLFVCLLLCLDALTLCICIRMLVLMCVSVCVCVCFVKFQLKYVFYFLILTTQEQVCKSTLKLLSIIFYKTNAKYKKTLLYTNICVRYTSDNSSKVAHKPVALKINLFILVQFFSSSLSKCLFLIR